MMWGSWAGWMNGDGSWLVGVAFWFAIVLAVVVGVAVWGARRRPGEQALEDSGSRETPLDILRRRYARGDISKDEFERVRRDLA